MRVLAHQRLERICTIMPQGSDWRLTTWSPQGPEAHSVFSDRELKREIAWRWKVDPTAGQRLEDWADTQTWREGLDGLRLVQAWNNRKPRHKEPRQ